MTTFQVPDLGQPTSGPSGGASTPPATHAEPAPTPPKTVLLKRRVLGASSRLGILDGIRDYFSKNPPRPASPLALR